ncbi:MAG: tetratricopeptide repeat protein [Terriglobales bacterium]
MIQALAQDAGGASTLQGSVRDSTGHPVAGATVYLHLKDGTQTLSALSDSAGAYRFSGLGEGIYVLRVEAAANSHSNFGPCALGPRETRKLDLTIESPKASPSASTGKADGESPEFFDEPQFTVAGVTDGTNLGGHGSNTVVRTKQSLAKDVASLSSIGEKSGDPLDAVREYQRAAELKPNESNYFDWGAELLLHRAVEPAIEVFGKGNRLFPRSARMLVALGVALYSNGAYDQAAQRLCEASDLNPDDASPYLFLGRIEGVESTQSECSTMRLARFTKLQPENALANYYYGVNLWKRRKGPDDAESWAQAELLLKKSVELDSRLAVGYLQLGVLYSERRDFSRAISSYQDAIRANPQLEEAHYRLAQAYKRTGEKTKAEQELQLYSQISKKKNEEAEREQRENRQFVYTLRKQDQNR